MRALEKDMNTHLIWIKIAWVIFLLLFEIRFLYLLQNVGGGPFSLLFISAYQLLFLACFYLAWKRRFQLFTHTLMLLLFINLFTNGLVEKIESFSNFKSLEPHLYHKVRVVGDVMPGFEGVNIITTDAKGFRAVRDIDYKSASNYRIFAIGGSTTEEIFTADNETWTGLLNEQLEEKYADLNSEIINTGVSGVRAEHHFATLKYTEKFHPNFYLFLLGVNDWNNHIKKLLSREDPSASTPNEFRNLQQTLIYAVVLSHYRSLRKFNNKGNNDPVVIVKKEFGDYYSKQNNSLLKSDVRQLTVSAVDPDYKNNIEKISERCLENSYKCMFISQPHAYSPAVTESLKKRFWMTPPNVDYTLDLESLHQIASFYNFWLESFAFKKQIPFCDLARQLKPAETVFYDDVHFNEMGSKEAAKIVFDCLEKYIYSGKSEVAVD